MCPWDLPVSLKKLFSGKKQNFVEWKTLLNENNFAVYAIAAHNTDSNIHLVFTGKIHTKICYLSMSRFIYEVWQ